jgi:hypothetical protein
MVLKFPLRGSGFMIFVCFPPQGRVSASILSLRDQYEGKVYSSSEFRFQSDLPGPDKNTLVFGCSDWNRAEEYSALLLKINFRRLTRLIRENLEISDETAVLVSSFAPL